MASVNATFRPEKLSHPVPWLALPDARLEMARLSLEVTACRDPRNKVKLSRRLTFAATAVAVHASMADMADIDAALAALALARGCGGATDYLNRAVASLSAARFERLGIVAAPIVAQAKKARVRVESACLIAAGAEPVPSEKWAGSAAAAVAAMNEGTFFMLSLGCDGTYSLAARLVDAPEPLLDAREYKLVTNTTEIGFLREPGGRLHFGAAENPHAGIALDVPQGSLQLRIFELGKGPKFTLVASPAPSRPQPLRGIPEFG